MKPQIFDSTAGARAREISTHPERPQRIVDASNPRFGKPLGQTRKPAGGQDRGRSDPERDALAA